VNTLKVDVAGYTYIVDPATCSMYDCLPFLIRPAPSSGFLTDWPESEVEEKEYCSKLSATNASAVALASPRSEPSPSRKPVQRLMNLWASGIWTHWFFCGFPLPSSGGAVGSANTDVKRNDTKNVVGFIFLFCDGLGILEESLAERFGELMRDRETALEVGTSSLFTLVFASSIYYFSEVVRVLLVELLGSGTASKGCRYIHVAVATTWSSDMRADAFQSRTRCYFYRLSSDMTRGTGIGSLACW